MHENPAPESKYYDKTQDANIDHMKSEYLDLLDVYFSGALDEQELQSLENQLKTDARLEELFREYRDLRKGIDYSIMKTLKEDLHALEATLPEVRIKSQTGFQEEEPTIGRRFVLLKVAAALILIAVSIVVVFQLQQPSSPQELFSQYFEPYPNEFVSAKRGDDVTADPMVQAFQAYDSQNYNVAIAGFTRLLDVEENEMVLFYLGSAQLSQNQSQTAIATFERFLEISQDYRTEATWYLALSYLKENRAEAARSLLEEIKDDQKFGQETAKILRRLK